MGRNLRKWTQLAKWGRNTSFTRPSLNFYIFQTFSFQGHTLRASTLLRIFQRNWNPVSLEILHKIGTLRPGAGVQIFEKCKTSNMVSKTSHFDPILRADFIFEGFTSFRDILAAIWFFLFFSLEILHKIIHSERFPITLGTNHKGIAKQNVKKHIPPQGHLRMGWNLRK